MTMQDLVFTIIVVFFVLVTLMFAIRYSNLLKLAQMEYERAKSVISGIVLAFRNEQDRQTETVGQLAFQMEIARSDIERLTNRIRGIENQFRNLFEVVKSTPDIYKEVINRVGLIQKEVSTISEKQENLQNQLTALEKKAQEIGKEEKSLATVSEERPFSRLTETESIVLQFLINEGAKTSSDVEAKIEKTREHTARLMKKLWQEGYIERDTHRIPYVYRANENLGKMDLKELEKKT